MHKDTQNQNPIKKSMPKNLIQKCVKIGVKNWGKMVSKVPDFLGQLFPVAVVSGGVVRGE
jgi:hypothetical protein